MATHGIVPVIKLVGLDEAPLILVLVVCFNELTCERALNSLIISRVTSILGVQVIRSSHGWRVVPDCKTRNQVHIFNTKLILVPATRLNLSLPLSMLWYEGFFGIADTCLSILFIANRVSCALMKLVMVLQDVFFDLGWAISRGAPHTKVRISYRFEAGVGSGRPDGRTAPGYCR